MAQILGGQRVGKIVEIGLDQLNQAFQFRQAAVFVAALQVLALLQADGGQDFHHQALLQGVPPVGFVLRQVLDVIEESDQLKTDRTRVGLVGKQQVEHQVGAQKRE